MFQTLTNGREKYECETNFEDIFGDKVRAPCWRFYPPGD